MAVQGSRGFVRVSSSVQAYLCADVAAVALALRRSVSAIKRRVRTLILCHPDERVPKSITEALKTALAASARQGNTDLVSSNF